MVNFSFFISTGTLENLKSSEGPAPYFLIKQHTSMYTIRYSRDQEAHRGQIQTKKPFSCTMMEPPAHDRYGGEVWGPLPKIRFPMEFWEKLKQNQQGPFVLHTFILTTP